MPDKDQRAPRRGRPPIPAAEQLRNRVTVNVNDDQLAWLDAQADSRRRSRQDEARARLLRGYRPDWREHARA